MPSTPLVPAATAGGQDDPTGQIPVLRVQGAASFRASIENIISRPAAATYLDETPCILYNQYFDRAAARQSSFNTAVYCANNRATLEDDAVRACERLNYYDLMRRKER